MDNIKFVIEPWGGVYLGESQGHKWAWLGDPAIACPQCVDCKILKPYDQTPIGRCLKIEKKSTSFRDWDINNS